MRTFLLILILAIGVNLLLISGSGKFDNANTSSVPVDFKNGDLVVRNGRGMISNWFRMLSENDKEYSHAGLVRKTQEGLYVVHMSQDRSGIYKEKFSDFINESVCTSYAVYRYDISVKQNDAIASQMDQDLSDKISFDTKFNLDSLPPFYCTEWISNRISKLTGYRFKLSGTSDYAYIGVDDLYQVDGIKKLYKKSYE